MTSPATGPAVEAMLHELLDRQRRHDRRLAALEEALARAGSDFPLSPVRPSPRTTSDTVSFARQPTPVAPPRTRRADPKTDVLAPFASPAPPAPPPTGGGGVIAAPPPRRAAAPTLADSGVPSEAIEVWLAASGEERADEADRRAQQARRLESVGRLTAAVAHDFNNLLTLICGNAELIREGLPADDGLRESAGEVLAAGRSAAALTRKLLALARPSRDEPHAVDLNDVVRGAEGLARRLLGEGPTFALDLAPAVGLIRADPSQVEHVLFNLVANARDALGAGPGWVRVRTAVAPVAAGRPGWPAALPPGAYVELAVGDSGCGMSEAVRARLFEPFFTTKPPDRGTGLGLANVRDALRRAGGHVEVDSAVGRGTAVRAYWPSFAAGEGG